jgi:hypothetical protein
MGDTTPEPGEGTLLSHYRADREPDGRLMIRAASPMGPVLGCAVPAAVVSLAALIVRAPAVTVLLVLFALVVIPILLYNGARAWVCGPGMIQPGVAFGPRRWFRRPPQPASSVVLRREVWSSKRGSTDSVICEVGSARRLKILSVHNWAGHESRLASGGRGSLSRSGPVVPSAPAPLRKATDTSLLWLASEAVRELTEVLHRELGAPLKFECDETALRPRRTIR